MAYIAIEIENNTNRMYKLKIYIVVEEIYKSIYMYILINIY